jgi:hypothetical protein
VRYPTGQWGSWQDNGRGLVHISLYNIPEALKRRHGQSQIRSIGNPDKTISRYNPCIFHALSAKVRPHRSNWRECKTRGGLWPKDNSSSCLYYFGTTSYHGWVIRRRKERENKKRNRNWRHMPEFFRRTWESSKEDMLAVMSNMFKDGVVTANQKHSIVLCVTKTSCPTRVKEYRPLILLNTDYKLLATIITNFTTIDTRGATAERNPWHARKHSLWRYCGWERGSDTCWSLKHTSLHCINRL